MKSWSGTYKWERCLTKMQASLQLNLDLKTFLPFSNSIIVGIKKQPQFLSISQHQLSQLPLIPNTLYSWITFTLLQYKKLQNQNLYLCKMPQWLHWSQISLTGSWRQEGIFIYPLSQFLFTGGNLVVSKMSLLFSIFCLSEKCLDKNG